jgi:selenocysteine lyase/cysteine desulfurase
MVSDRGCHVLEFFGACCDFPRSAQCCRGVRCGLASPRQASQRGVFGCIEVGSRSNTESRYQTLRDERFVVALREGRIRVAPHLLNSTQDIDRLLVIMEYAQKEARRVRH